MPGPGHKETGPGPLSSAGQGRELAPAVPPLA